jgi:hypothetical protein
MTMPADRSEIARKAAAARWGNRQQQVRDLSRYVEVVPGVWQPEGMAEAERWKQQQRRANGKER